MTESAHNNWSLAAVIIVISICMTACHGQYYDSISSCPTTVEAAP